MTATIGPEQIPLQLALRRLWSDHVIWTREHVVAAIANAPDTQAVAGRLLANQADRRWDQNARDIASLLSSANPNWPERDVVDLLRQHLKLTKDEATARLGQRWEDDIEAFDQILTEILTVSDVLAAGIVKQFPDRFPQAERAHRRLFGR
jgi:hypothetical protein